MKNVIQAIQLGLRQNAYASEAAVINGVVLRILHALGWDIFSSNLVYPQYPIDGGFADLAICHPPMKPFIVVEVKKVGFLDGAEQQLFSYAGNRTIGIPMALLTDGRTWNFYLTGEQGSAEERLVYKLDILERSVEEVVARLRSYLSLENVISGAALEAAREDYRSVCSATPSSRTNSTGGLAKTG